MFAIGDMLYFLSSKDEKLNKKELIFEFFNNPFIYYVLRQKNSLDFSNCNSINEIEELILKNYRELNPVVLNFIDIPGKISCNNLDIDNFQFADENSFTNVLISDAIGLLDLAEKMQKKVILKFYFGNSYNYKVLFQMGFYSLKKWLFESHGIAFRNNYIDRINLSVGLNDLEDFYRFIGDKELDKESYYFNENIEYRFTQDRFIYTWDIYADDTIIMKKKNQRNL